MNLRQIRAREDAIVASSGKDLDTLRKIKQQTIRRMKIRCAGTGTVLPHAKPYRNGCGKESPVRLWALSCTYFGNHNTGDPSRGFEWEYGEPQYDYLICPKCERWNDTHNHPQKAKILELREAAGELPIFALVSCHITTTARKREISHEFSRPVV